VPPDWAVISTEVSVVIMVKISFIPVIYCMTGLYAHEKIV
jgi:hypothetical protein